MFPRVLYSDLASTVQLLMEGSSCAHSVFQIVMSLSQDESMIPSAAELSKHGAVCHSPGKRQRTDDLRARALVAPSVHGLDVLSLGVIGSSAPEAWSIFTALPARSIWSLVWTRKQSTGRRTRHVNIVILGHRPFCALGLGEVQVTSELKK